MAKESAEEKLLKMMKRPASSIAAKSSLPAPVKKKFKFAFSIGLLNIFLFLGIIICCVLLVVEFLSGSAMLSTQVRFSLEAKNKVPLSDISLPAVPDVDYYLQQTKEWDIFKPYVPKPNKAAMVKDLQQQLSRYRLVGIAWLDLPETASIMMSDMQNNKVFFLKSGDEIEGITVKSIFTDRAVFSHNGEETTVKL